MKHSLKGTPILLAEVHYIAYQKLVAEKMNKLKEAKKYLEEAEKIFSVIQYDFDNEIVSFNCAKKDTESAIRFLNRYIKLVRQACPSDCRSIYVPKEGVK